MDARTAERSLGPVHFSDLRAHLARGAVFVVAPSLALLEVADALARDDRVRVAAWLEAGLLARPSAADVARWEAISGDIAVTVVVQPFVLLQELAT